VIIGSACTGHADADLRQHGRYGNADLLVVDIAVVRAVQTHFEAVGIACLGQQSAGARRVVRIPHLRDPE
jgi:hypothetical protein